MTPAEREGLRALAEALGPTSGVMVPREWLLELLDGSAVQTSALGTTVPTDEQLLTVQEVANRFGLTEDWLYRHWKDVGGVKLGRKVLRFPPGALRQYITAKANGRR
jgi:predicted DNA-binding transcriptional regulator AlpA